MSYRSQKGFHSIKILKNNFEKKEKHQSMHSNNSKLNLEVISGHLLLQSIMVNNK
jgi:hypothetical protein